MIPPRNLYYMLLYAWGHFRPSEVPEVGKDDSPNLPTLLAKVLLERTHRLLRQGLDRGYIDHREETRNPRGRLCLDEMVKRQTMQRGLAVCDIDDLTPDILHNKILLETLTRLSGSSLVDRAVRHQIYLTTKRMNGVSRIRLTAGTFLRVQLSRNSSQYRLLMQISEFLFHELMPDSTGRASRFEGIALDQIRMPALFEEFLRRFYGQELLGARARAETMLWHASSQTESDMGHLPVMKTDITIRSPGRILVVDAKYYPKHLVLNQFGGERLISAHLYQLSTYLAHMAYREPDQSVSGLLIYPQNREKADLRYLLLGRSVKVATVDLGMEWDAIHSRLIELVDEQ